MKSHVLIIEDDSVLLRGLSDNFTDAGYRVSTATDGQHGVDQALANEPQLVLLDIMLPKLNGYEVCRRIRQQQMQMPIIMLTAKGQEEDIVRGLDLGADDYVTKPFSIRELLARTQAFLRRHATPPTDRYQFGPFVLDDAAHRLTRDDQEIELTAKEYRLLQHFVRRAGRAMTRKELLDAVWGRSIIVTDRSVDRCVTTLRSKVELDPQHPQWIHTIRGVGYRFEAD